ncbi:unnamed protein product [Psylliodes chrysocephalus]|uniref:Calcineurin-like phosphoesterase domain-containing protein n=1 Tax=Psylliodes chrysocephalus TaxID=3402493 RepID=A0A9P0GD44_9CUCU|nr:unnamed protein product [Psylliodes chrysocephala]
MRYSRKKIFLCMLSVLLIGTIVYIELFSYYINTYNWRQIQCQHRDKCTKILLVADPQIIGNHEEILHFLTPLTIFDSDRFLMKTYIHAYNFIEPDIVIFLGDLMDEAHRASNHEFHQYVRRIINIFLDTSSSSSVRHIWLPGDNDIGGEDSLVTKEKIERFEHAFSQPSFITFRHLNLFKINRLVSEIPVYKKKREFFDTSEIFIGLSHVPLLFKPSIFVEKVLNKMMPHVLFTAHEHKSMIINTDAHLRQDIHLTQVTPENHEIFEYSLGTKDIYEFLIPTASYRMGTNKIGYGYAVIENNDLKYTVLWSPSRFNHLILYGFLVFLLFLYSLNKILCKCCRLLKCSHRKKIYSY